MAALNLRSQSFSITRAATGSGASAVIDLSTNTTVPFGVDGVFVGQRVSGTNIGTDAVVSSINTTARTVTLSVNNTGSVSGNVTFGEVTKNAPLTNVEIDGNFTELIARINTKAAADRGTLTNVTISSGTATLSTLTVDTITVSGNGSGLAASAIASGNVSIARGGTNGSAVPTAGAIAYGTGSAYAFTTVGTSGQFLTSNGTGAPSWSTLSVPVTNDTTSTQSTFYPMLSPGVANGNVSTVFVSSTKMYFTPSTGTLNATQFNAFSDAAHKDNVATVSTALSTIDKLRGVSFNWKDNGNKSYGVIAQELEQVLPELVTGTDAKSVNYAGLTAFLINAVKELHARVQTLERA